MTHDPQPSHRRRFLIGSALSAAGCLAGCGRTPQPDDDPAEQERRDVPIRLLMTGSEEDAEAIRRGWNAVTEHPLDVRAIPLSRTDAASLASTLLEQATQFDLLIYPLALVAEASVAGTVAALSDEELESMEESSGSLYAALRAAATRYAGQNLAVPLGASLPALLSREEAVEEGKDAGSDGLESWEAYDQLVAGPWAGNAAEPTAPGWAGTMFLWRSTTVKSWLFDREDLQPLVNDEPYLESLELMLRTHARCKTQSLTPGQVWSGVKSGDLRGGIGFPQFRGETSEEFQVRNLPGASELSKVLLDPFSPVISLSVACRQSSAAKRFIQWISGGEGSGAARQQVAGMTDTRREVVEGALERSAAGKYDRWLADRLSSPVTLPTLQLISAGRYYQALDQQIVRALTGQRTPKQALNEVANQWNALTKNIGVTKQRRAWRRARGLRI